MASAAPHGTRGVVVQRDARGGAVVLATQGGALQRVKFAKPNRLAMGTVVRMSGSKLSVVGHTHKAKLHGVVVRRNKHSFALAGNGSVLAVASTSPPAAGQQVTTNVQVDQTQLSDNDGECQVEDNQSSSTKLRGTVLSQDATTLRLNFPGFTAGLPIAIGTVKLPALAPNTPVVVRVTLGPDATGNGIVLTLVSLRLDNGHHGDSNLGTNVKAEGSVKMVTDATATLPGSITIDDEDGPVTFIIPVGFGLTGVTVGDEVEAWGTAGATAADMPTLVRLESSDNGDGDHHDGGHNDHHSNDGGSGGSDGSGGSGNDD
jgi:hypothetical protein